METRQTSDFIFVQLHSCTAVCILKVQHQQIENSMCFLLSLQQQIEMGKRQIESIPLKYCKIDFEKRLELIQAVLVDKESIINASKSLGIKFSTAKLIIKRYKENGYIFQKKGDQQVRKQARGEKVGDFNIKKQEEGVINSKAGSDLSDFYARQNEGLFSPQFPLFTCYYYDPFGNYLPNIRPFS